MQKLNDVSKGISKEVASYGVNIIDGREVIAKQFGSYITKAAYTSSTETF